MASEAEKLKALKLKEKAKALKEKEKAKALKEKEKAKALKEKEKAKALKEKEKAKALKEKAKKAREKAKKAKDSKKGGTDEAPFYMCNLVYDTLNMDKNHLIPGTEVYPLFISFTEYPINTYLTSITSITDNTLYGTFVRDLYHDYKLYIKERTTDMNKIVEAVNHINKNVAVLFQEKKILNGDSILAYLNWVHIFVYLFFIKNKPETLNDQELNPEYNESLNEIMDIITHEDTTGKKYEYIQKKLTGAGMFTQSSTLGRQPGFSLGEVAEALRNR
jgi:hypothetical protein